MTGTNRASEHRAFMMDAVSGALPLAGAVLSLRHQEWWLLLSNLAALAVALVLASDTARGRSWVFPKFKCWQLALLTSLVATLVVALGLGWYVRVREERDIEELRQLLFAGHVLNPGVHEFRGIGGAYTSELYAEGVMVTWFAPPRGSRCQASVNAVSAAAAFVQLDSHVVLKDRGREDRRTLDADKLADECVRGVRTVTFWAPAAVLAVHDAGTVQAVSETSAPPDMASSSNYTQIKTTRGDVVVESVLQPMRERFEVGKVVRVESRSNGKSYICASAAERGSLKCPAVLRSSIR